MMIKTILINAIEGKGAPSLHAPFLHGPTSPCTRATVVAARAADDVAAHAHTHAPREPALPPSLMLSLSPDVDVSDALIEFTRDTVKIYLENYDGQKIIKSTFAEMCGEMDANQESPLMGTLLTTLRDKGSAPPPHGVGAVKAAPPPLHLPFPPTHPRLLA